MPLIHRVIGLTICLLTVLVASVEGHSVFPKIIWNWWDKGYDSAKLFTKLCFENKRRTAEASGWEFRLLNGSTLGNYLNMTLFNEVKAKLPEKKPPKIANLVRLMLMMKYGGMWIDSDSYFLRDLSWAEQPQNTILLHNKMAS